MGARTLTRRALLASAAVAPLVACTRESGPTPPPDPDDVLRAEAVERERALLRQYDAVVLALPSLAARLAPLRAEHAEHLAALAGAEPSPSPAVPEPAPAPAAGLQALAAAERAAATAHGQASLEASRELAAVLASLSASEQSHLVVLR